MRVSLCTAALLGLGLGVVAQDAAAQEDQVPVFVCPLPDCGKCPSEERSNSPGVGFALEIGYGTVSVRHNNGTFEHVTRVRGSPAYVSLMQSLATSPIERMMDGTRLPPGVDEQDWTTMPLWVLFHTKRWLNKLIGRPATPEVGILAIMVTQLRQKAEAHLGRRIIAAAISAPDRVRLTWQEVGDIFDYLSMEDLVKDKNNPLFDELFSMSAASAGYGLGLCLNYIDAYSCAKEEHFAPDTLNFQLDFSNQSLIGAVRQSRTSRKGFSHLTFIDLSLGFGGRPGELSEADAYWHAIETRIRDFVGKRRLERLLLIGERASEPRFIKAIKDALSNKISISGVTGSEETTTSTQAAAHFLFATSMGAAEFAKRRQEGMARCQLPLECRANRGDRVSEDHEEL